MIIINAWLGKYKTTYQMLRDMRSLMVREALFSSFKQPLNGSCLEEKRKQIDEWRNARLEKYGEI